MRALAEGIMSGRWQAAIVAFIGLPVISPAAVGLVTLRRGAPDGAWILAALLFPMVLWMLIGTVWWAFMLASLLASLLIFVSAWVLRVWSSWSLTLVVISSVATLSAWLLVWGVDLRADMLAMADMMDMGEIDKLRFEKSVDELLAYNVATPAIALSTGFGVVLSLMLARWWQAQLYNPGGFREEFHSLRMEAKLVAVSVAMAIGLMQLPGGGGGILIAMLPLFFSGLAYIHWWAAQKRLPWILWVLYFSMLFSIWVASMVVTVGMLDSILDLRKRINDRG